MRTLVTLASFTFLAATAAVQAAVSVTQYGITWTWVEDREIGTFANGDYWVVGPITLTSITPQTAIVSGRRAHGSMINPMPGNYVSSQGFDASLSNYNDAQNIALVGGNPLSPTNSRAVPAGSSLCTVISSASGDRGAVREAFTDFAVLTVLASAPAAGSFRPPYTGTDKTIKWNKSQLNYGILRNLTPVAGMSAPSPGKLARTWVEIEADYNLARSWHPINNQPEYDRDMAYAVADLMLPLHTNYSNAQKEPAYIAVVQYGIDVYSQIKRGAWNINGTVYPLHQGNSQTKPALVLAALALDDADMKSYCSSVFIPNPYGWNGGMLTRMGADTPFWYVASQDVGRSVNTGNTYGSADVGNPEWGMEHWGDRNKDSSAWGATYRDVRYTGIVGLCLAMQLTTGARELWNHPAYFDYFDRAFEIYTTSVPDPTPRHVKLFWNSYRSLGGPVWSASLTPPPTPSAATLAGAP